MLIHAMGVYELVVGELISLDEERVSLDYFRESALLLFVIAPSIIVAEVLLDFFGFSRGIRGLAVL